jgi:hypothetical protein
MLAAVADRGIEQRRFGAAGKFDEIAEIERLERRIGSQQGAFETGSLPAAPGADRSILA